VEFSSFASHGGYRYFANEIGHHVAFSHAVSKLRDSLTAEAHGGVTHNALIVDYFGNLMSGFHGQRNSPRQEATLRVLAIQTAYGFSFLPSSPPRHRASRDVYRDVDRGRFKWIVFLRQNKSCYFPNYSYRFERAEQLCPRRAVIVL
jgi:hypothetical protein